MTKKLNVGAKGEVAYLFILEILCFLSGRSWENFSELGSRFQIIFKTERICIKNLGVATPRN